MAYIKNPSYNPNDPKSLRYIEQANPAPTPTMTTTATLPLPTKISPALATPVPATVPKVDPNAITIATGVPGGVPAKAKTSSYAGLPTANNTISPSIANMSINPNPAPTSQQSYTVQSGDTLNAIAARSGTTVAEIQRLNPSIVNPNLIQPGQRFVLPGQPSAPASATPTTPTPTDAAAPSGGNMPSATPTTPTAPTTPEIPLTGDQKTDQAMQDLAKKAGASGMSLADYVAFVQGQNTITQEQSNATRTRLGIPNLIDDAFGKPSKSTVDQYKEQYDMSGLKDVKESIKKLDNEIAQKRADLVKATGELYNNPWISQATRSGRLGNLQRIALADIQNSIDQKDQYLSLYDKGVAEIEDSIKRSVYDAGLEKDLTVDKLNYLLTEAEREDQFVQRAIQQRALRYTPDFLAAQPKEGYTLSEGQTRYDASGKAIATNAGAGSTGGKLVKIGDKEYIQHADGSFSLPTLPQAPADPATVQGFDDKLTLVDSILNSGVLDTLVGPTSINRAFNPFSLGEQQALSASINQLVDQETLDKLVALKAQGGTLGAISEKELAILQQAATKFKTWEVKDENGNPTGRYRVGEKQFKEELERIKGSTQRLRAAAAGQSGTPPKLEDIYKNADTNQKKRIDALIQQNPSYTPEQVLQVLGFNQVSGDTKTAALKQSLIQQESGGNYKAVGDVPAGYSAADRALGKYQIIPKFHFAKIGVPNTPEGRQQFLNSPQLQDKLFEAIIDELSVKYQGNPQKIAAAYYGGDGAAQIVGTKAADKPQYAGGKPYPSINQYVQSVTSRLS